VIVQVTQLTPGLDEAVVDGRQEGVDVGRRAVDGDVDAAMNGVEQAGASVVVHPLDVLLTFGGDPAVLRGETDRDDCDVIDWVQAQLEVKCGVRQSHTRW